ncbi:MAG: hypothetical protein WCR42_10990 [bacterium]
MFFAFFLIFLLKTPVFGQCNCVNGAAIGGMTPVSGTTNVGVLQKKNMRSLLFYKFGEGDKFFKGDVVQDTGDIKLLRYQYMGLVLGYGITDKFTVEAETGYFLDKFQDWGFTKYSASGLSHLLLSAKYNFLFSPAREMEFSAGLGAKLPLQFETDSIPQNILPSTGDYSGILTLFFHKGFSDSKSRFIIINTTSYNSTNTREYQYGMFNYTSFIFAKTFFEKWTGILELRNEFRARDKWYKDPVVNSGGWSVNVAPQINFSYSYFNLSFLFDYPLYQYLNGSQLGMNYSASLNLNWEFSFEKPVPEMIEEETND